MTQKVEQWTDAADEILGRLKYGLAWSAEIAAIIASHAPSDKNAEGLIWAVERWNLEVRNRPLINAHRRTLDETWRQVIRYFGGDPDELIGPPPQYIAPEPCPELLAVYDTSKYGKSMVGENPREAAAQPTNANCQCGPVEFPDGLRHRFDCPARRAEIEHNDH